MLSSSKLNALSTASTAELICGQWPGVTLADRHARRVTTQHCARTERIVV